MMTPSKATGGIIGATLVLLGVPIAIIIIAQGVTSAGILALWLGGAGVIGLLSGFTSGASKTTGTASEFLKFISGGIVVPLLGGIATLLRVPQTTIETSTYEGEHLIKKTTEVLLASPTAHLQPLAILGSFFLVYGAFALLGLFTGYAHRKGGGIELPAMPGM